jgi:hypothetical protein
MFITVLNVLWITACSRSELYEDDFQTHEEHMHAPWEQASPVDTEGENAASQTPETPVTTSAPAVLTAKGVPQGVEPADYLRELGHGSFSEYEYLQWGTHWVALLTDEVIRNLRIISVIPRYEAFYENGWHITQQFFHSWTYHEIDLLPDEPFVMAWRPDQNITERGLRGVWHTDYNGHDRFYLLRQNDGETYLEAFENTPYRVKDPKISVFNIEPEIEMVAAWLARFTVDGRGISEDDVLTAKARFLQQFETYTALENHMAVFSGWVVFSTNTALYDFQLFTLGQVCDPWLDGEWHLYYVREIMGAQDVLPFGIPVVVPWHPGGTHPSFGIGFTDKNGERRNFTLNDNVGSGFPPLFIREFMDRVYCFVCKDDE